jgi:hypothetical protein
MREKTKIGTQFKIENSKKKRNAKFPIIRIMFKVHKNRKQESVPGRFQVLQLFFGED